MLMNINSNAQRREPVFLTGFMPRNYTKLRSVHRTNIISGEWISSDNEGTFKSQWASPKQDKETQDEKILDFAKQFRNKKQSMISFSLSQSSVTKIPPGIPF
jgi:hypothetical protein